MLVLLAERADTRNYTGERLRHLGAVWRQLRHAKSTSDLQCIERYKGADRRQYGVTLDLSRPYKVCKAERNKWIHYIYHIQSLVKSSGLRNPSESEIVSLMKKDLGTQPGDLPDLGDKLDSVSRMIARLVVSLSRLKMPTTQTPKGDVVMTLTYHFCFTRHYLASFAQQIRN